MTVTKSDAENGTAQGDASLAGAVYGIYKGETLVDSYTTDKNGQFVSKEYICDDDWTVREITPSEGYLLDNTVYKVGAEPELYTVEHNQTANDVTEQVINGNIAIIKHTDDGETQIETPESGAEFEVYLKASGSYENAKASERDYLTCDENGFAETKDLPYGIYTVHQVSGWEGSEKMSDFDVFISQDGATYRYIINNAPFNSFIKIVKQDAETGKNIPYAGAAFKIYDPEGNPVTMTFTYPTPTTIDVFYTNAEGSLVTPEKLPYGKGYSIVEVQAPYGYVLDETPVYFDVTEDNSTEESGVTVVKVDNEDQTLYVKRDIGDSVAICQCVAQELGHAQLAMNCEAYSRRDMGFSAVCVGYMLCRKFGVDVKNFAIESIPDELKNKEPKDIRAALSRTRSAMNEISSRVSEEMYRQKQERSKDRDSR